MYNFSLCISLLLVGYSQCFSLVPRIHQHPSTFLHQVRTSSTYLMARGRKSITETVGGGEGGSSKQPASSSSTKSGFSSKNNSVSTTPESTKHWTPVKGIKSLKDLPREENIVKAVDTMADVLIDGATNPTGAVSILNSDGKTYCFSVSCASCKFPLLKAKVLPPNAQTGNVHHRVSCDFCKATYNAKTGERVTGDEESGLMGTIVKSLFSASDKTPLKTYELGEKNGQVFINLPITSK